MSLLPVANWKSPTLLGDHESPAPHRVIVRLKNGNTIGGTLRVAQETSLQLASGGSIWTFFAEEWDSVEIIAVEPCSFTGCYGHYLAPAATRWNKKVWCAEHAGLASIVK